MPYYTYMILYHGSGINASFIFTKLQRDVFHFFGTMYKGSGWQGELDSAA